jgi:hypothetical protein
MLDAPAMALRIAASPVWLLWRGYLMLWWAFDDSPERAAARLSAKTTAAADVAPPKFVEGGDSGQASAFEWTDSRPPKRPLPPPMPRPEALLKGAFAGSMILCGMTSMIAAGLAAGDAISPARAGALWLWFSAVVVLGSVLGVRRIARKRWEKPKGPIARAKDATVHAARAARDAAADRAMAAIHFMRGEKHNGARVQIPTPVEAHQPESRAVPPAAPTEHAGAVRRAAGVAARGVGRASHEISTRLVPAVARGARGVLDPLRDRAAGGLAWASRKIAKG